MLQTGGVVIRYGQLWGPGTYYPTAPPDPPRIHVAAAARQTLPALQAPPGLTIVADDSGPRVTPVWGSTRVLVVGELEASSPRVGPAKVQRRAAYAIRGLDQRRGRHRADAGGRAPELAPGPGVAAAAVRKGIVCSVDQLPFGLSPGL